MKPKQRSRTLFDRIVDALSKQEKDYEGIRFDNPQPRWQEGYGNEPDSDLPDFVKKDNDGWEYVQRSDGK